MENATLAMTQSVIYIFFALQTNRRTCKLGKNNCNFVCFIYKFRCHRVRNYFTTKRNHSKTKSLNDFKTLLNKQSVVIRTIMPRGTHTHTKRKTSEQENGDIGLRAMHI